MLSRAGAPRDPVLSGDDLAATVRQVRQEVGAPAELTDAVVGAAGEGQRQVVVHPDGVIRPRWPGAALEVARQVGAQAGVGLEDLCSRTRARSVVAARRLALWLWARELNRRQSEMNGVLGLSSGRGSRMLQRVSTGERRLAQKLAGELWGATPWGDEEAKGR